MASAKSTDNRAVQIVRYSPKPDVSDVQSLNVQMAANERYAALTGLQIVETFKDEEVSARKVPLDKRPGGSAMLAYIEQHRIKHIVVMATTRIFRSTIDGLRWQAKWAKAKVQLHLSNEGGVSLCTNTAMGKFIFRQMLSVAELEPDLLGERTSQGMKHRQANGQRMSGHLPFGRRLEGGRLVEDADEQQLRRRIVELGGGNLSLREIARRVMAEGHTFRGGTIRHNLVKRALETAG